MFKSLAASNGFSTHTNPCWLEVGGSSVLATAGQNLDDVFKYVEGEDEKRLELAKNMLEWRHMAPTAPDTLCESIPYGQTGRNADTYQCGYHFVGCHPFDETDPFILKHAPDVYIVGNQPRFETAVVKSQSSFCSPHTPHLLTKQQIVLDEVAADIFTCDHTLSDDRSEPTRVILSPKFSETGTLVLVHTTTLEVRTVEFGVPEGDEVKTEMDQ